MQIHVKARYVNEIVEVQFRHYANGVPAIELVSLDGVPACVATVNLDEKPNDSCVWLKGWSENEGIPEVLVKAGIVKLTGRIQMTGYCVALEAQLLKTESEVAIALAEGSLNDD